MSDLERSEITTSASGSRDWEPSRSGRLFARIAELGSSAQAAIPGLYAWAVTVAPAAWSRGGSLVAQIAAIFGLAALISAPFIERAGKAVSPSEAAGRRKLMRAWTGPTSARVWSVWGFVLSSAVVWALAPTALSSVRLDGVRGVLGLVGWGLFAFASAGPALRVEEGARARVVAGSALKPRSELPRGDGVYVGVGVVLALMMQALGWNVSSPERAVLVRVVTVGCGIAVLGAMTSIGLARHGGRVPASSRVRTRRALPWMTMLLLFVGSGVAVWLLR